MATKVDKDYHQLKANVKNALEDNETPLKEKHVQATIAATYRYQGLATFWAIAFKQPIFINRISAWKFCQLLHKIFREGHHLCCLESQGNIKYLTDVGKFWSHLTDGYGNCTLQYTKLLTTKIEFHTRNRNFPGSLQMSRTEIDQIGGGDIIVVYKLTIEIFDYLDRLIELQATVFNSLNTFPVGSMTPAEQCRVSALIPCIEEAKILHDISLCFMLKLHTNLPHDELVAHRQRFKTIFRQLRSFYKQSDDLPDLVNLVTVPKLPCELPNFSCNNEYKTNIGPESKSVWEKIMLFDEVPKREEPKPEPLKYCHHLNRERDLVVKNLHNQWPTICASLNVHQDHYDQQFSKLNEEQIMLKNEIRIKDTVFQQVQLENQILEEKIRQHDLEKSKRLNSNRDHLIQQLHIELFTFQKEKQILEEKIQNHAKEISDVEEKFAKLLPLYMETRTDHINLLRQTQENNKTMRELKKSFEGLVKDKVNVENELTELKRYYEANQKLHRNWVPRKI